MNKSEITKNLKQIKVLLEEDSPMIAKSRIDFLIDDIDKDSTINEDNWYRQGRSKRQEESNEKVMFVASIGLAVTIFSMILYGIFF